MPEGFFNRNGFRIIMLVVFSLGLVWMGTKRTFLSNSNAVEDWLPGHYQETREYRWFLDHFPFESYIVVSWDGCTLDDDRVELFAQKLVPSQKIENFSLASEEEPIRATLDLYQSHLSNPVDPDLTTPDHEVVRGWSGKKPNIGSITPKAERLKDDASLVGNGTLPESSLPAADQAANQAANQAADKKSDPAQDSSKASAEPPTEGTNAEYFRSVMTGPRLVRLLEETASRTSSGQSAEELHDEIVEKLKGTLIGPDGESTAMIVTLNTGFKGGGKKMQQLIDRIKAVSVECGLPDTANVRTGSFAAKAAGALVNTVREIIYGRNPRTDGLILGGPPVDNAALDREGTQTLLRLAGFCALISVTLAIICLKDIRLTMFVFWVSILSAGVALAMVSFTGGKCDSILLSMPALVYVLAMSGSIHLVNYWQDAVREKGLDNAAERTVTHAFAPCFFAQLTTAIGLGSLFAGKLFPITNFGLYSALGVMTTLLLLFFYLPALLNAFPCRGFAAKYGGQGMNHSVDGIHRFWDWFGKIIVRHHNSVAILCMLTMVFFGFYLPKIKTSVKMMNFFSDDAEIIAHYGFLEEKLGPLVPMELVIRFDNTRLPKDQFGTPERYRMIRDLEDRLKSELSGEIGGVLSAGLFIPDPDVMQRPGTLAHRIATRAVGRAVEMNRENLKDYLTVEGNPTLAEIQGSLSAEQKRLEADEGTAALEKAAAAAAQLAALTQNETFLAENGMTDLKSLTERLENSKPFRTLDAQTVDLLLGACHAWQDTQGKELWRLSIRVWALKKDIDYSVFIQNVRNVVEPFLAEKTAEWLGPVGGAQADKSISAVYTGMVPIVYKTQHALIQGLTGSLLTAFILITLLMILLLGSVGAGLVAMLPNIFPVVVVFGFIAWIQMPVDVGTMMTASIGLGVAIDDTLHYLTWYREGIRRGLSPKGAAERGYRRCAKAMTESSLISGLGLSAFMLSTFVPTQRFGLLMLATLFAAEIGDLIFLPALLTGPLGRFFQIRRKKRPTSFTIVPQQDTDETPERIGSSAAAVIYPVQYGGGK